MKPLKRCANGCPRPPDPPSKVICRECMDKISRKLEAMVSDAAPADKDYLDKDHLDQ